MLIIHNDRYDLVKMKGMGDRMIKQNDKYLLIIIIRKLIVYYYYPN